MYSMRAAQMVALAITGALTLAGVAGCGWRSSLAADDRPYIGVILPDAKTSARWETADRRFLAEALARAGVRYDIQNAQGDVRAFQTIADSMIVKGVDVLLITNLDNDSGKAVLDKAKSQGVATIDYDRLTLGGSASYYVSFDNVKVGRLLGEGLVSCLAATGVGQPLVVELHGSPDDNNATLVRQGYTSVLGPHYQSGEYRKGPNQAVPKWDNQQAATIFEQMFTQQAGRIDGVLAANDGVANAAISVLRKNKVRVPVTGQDATVQGLQNILLGDQCMTVYKAVRKEADAAVALALALAKGEPAAVTGTVHDPRANRDVLSVLEEPVVIFAANVKDVIADGYVSKADLCAGQFASRCAAVGVP